MDSKPSEPLATGSEEDSLESPHLEIDYEAPPPETGTGPALASPPPERWRRLTQNLKLNIYLTLFMAVVVLAIIIVIVAYWESRRNSGASKISSQNLSQSALEQLAESNATVGSSNQVLTVQSSAVFANKVLLRQDLEVAGNLQIGGTLALNAIAVSGASQFGQTTVNKNLAVAGATSLQGAVTIAKSLQVGGSGTFSGPLSAPQVTAGSLQLNGDLALTHHISAGGATPTRTNGGALGSGGTSSVSGSDTGGSITINTGGGPAAGCFITVNFSARYNATPHVIVTPIGSAAGGLSYYVNRSTTSFSICDATAPPAGSSFGFDYFVID
jgi:cytoskeletal protein CcmA (bactofilin family)